MECLTVFEGIWVEQELIYCQFTVERSSDEKYRTGNLSYGAYYSSRENTGWIRNNDQKLTKYLAGLYLVDEKKVGMDMGIFFRQELYGKCHNFQRMDKKGSAWLEGKGNELAYYSQAVG